MVVGVERVSTVVLPPRDEGRQEQVVVKRVGAQDDWVFSRGTFHVVHFILDSFPTP